MIDSDDFDFSFSGLKTAVFREVKTIKQLNNITMSNPFIPLINSWLPEPHAGLLAGILFGKTASFSPSFYQALITTGTLHVVALSGTNISMIINLVSKITYPLGRRIGSLVSIISVFAFILFVGPSSSVVRAGIMGAITILAVQFGRQKLSLLGLFIAAILMILFDEKVILTPSFQLSFGATLGIMIFAPLARVRKEEKLSFIASVFSDIKNLMIENLRVSLAAQVFTLPITIFAFGRYSIISPLTNVLISWTIFPIMILGISACVAGLIFNPLGQAITYLNYFFLEFFVIIINLTAKIPFASVSLK